MLSNKEVEINMMVFCNLSDKDINQNILRLIKANINSNHVLASFLKVYLFSRKREGEERGRKREEREKER